MRVIIMTEKRYKELTDGYCPRRFIDTKTKKKYVADESIGLLNSLVEENEQLKQQLDIVDDCLTRNDIKMLKAERGFE